MTSAASRSEARANLSERKRSSVVTFAVKHLQRHRAVAAGSRASGSIACHPLARRGLQYELIDGVARFGEQRLPRYLHAALRNDGAIAEASNSLVRRCHRRNHRACPRPSSSSFSAAPGTSGEVWLSVVGRRFAVTGGIRRREHLLRLPLRHRSHAQLAHRGGLRGWPSSARVKVAQSRALLTKGYKKESPDDLYGCLHRRIPRHRRGLKIIRDRRPALTCITFHTRDGAMPERDASIATSVARTRHMPGAGGRSTIRCRGHRAGQCARGELQTFDRSGVICSFWRRISAPTFVSDPAAVVRG